MTDPREHQLPGSERLSPDQGPLGERLDDADGSAIWGDEDDDDDHHDDDDYDYDYEGR